MSSCATLIASTLPTYPSERIHKLPAHHGMAGNTASEPNTTAICTGRHSHGTRRRFSQVSCESTGGWRSRPISQSVSGSNPYSQTMGKAVQRNLPVVWTSHHDSGISAGTVKTSQYPTGRRRTLPERVPGIVTAVIVSILVSNRQAISARDHAERCNASAWTAIYRHLDWLPIRTTV